MPNPTVARALQQAVARLTPQDESPRLAAEILLAHVLGKSREYLKAFPEHVLDPKQWEIFQGLIERRLQGEPVAYLTGRREFWSLNLRVTPDTLIPRPETERLVELALERIPRDAAWRILDLGTGSGAIALALACERPRCTVIATERSAEALRIAQENAARLQLRNVQFRAGSWYEAIGADVFDLIVSNPPYVAPGDPHLSRGDLRFEPYAALCAEGDGLNDLRSIANGAPASLRPGGWLLVEHGYDQQTAVRELFDVAGFVEIAAYADLAGVPRVVAGRFAPKHASRADANATR